MLSSQRCAGRVHDPRVSLAPQCDRGLGRDLLRRVWAPLAAYARAMSCPVLTSRVLLYQLGARYGARSLPLSSYAFPTRCPVLTKPVPLPGSAGQG
eukprot:2910023-Rhodomonas_salina.5